MTEQQLRALESQLVAKLFSDTITQKEAHRLALIRDELERLNRTRPRPSHQPKQAKAFQRAIRRKRATHG
jgi:hypothetical protein